MIERVRAGWNYRHPPGMWIRRPVGSGDLLFVLFRSRIVWRRPALPEAADAPAASAASVAAVAAEPDLQALPSGTCLLYPVGAAQEYGRDDESWLNDWFHFAMDAADRDWFDRLGLPFATPLLLADPFPLSDAVRALAETHQQGGALLPERLDARIRSLLLDLAAERAAGTARTAGEGRSTEDAAQDALRARFRPLRSEILGDCTADWTLEEMARRTHLSVSRFSAVYRSLYGTTPKQDVIAARIRYAGFLLRETALPVGEVASHSGYRSEEHFLRQFRSHSGCTPSEFRARERR